MKEIEEHSLPVDGLSKEAVRELMEKVAQMEKRDVEQQRKIEGQQRRIVELEAEVASLKERQEEAKGRKRKFSLGQITDYCKSCVEWRNVEAIVAMLNKLLRFICTEEDSKLVDSIEEHFLNRRYGNHIEHQTVIPQVGTYNASVQNQNNNFPAMPLGQQGQKQLER